MGLFLFGVFCLSTNGPPFFSKLFFLPTCCGAGGPVTKHDNVGERILEDEKRMINRVFKVIDSGPKIFLSLFLSFLRAL